MPRSVDRPSATLGPMWFVPSSVLENRNMGKEKIRFHANVNPGGGGQFDQYRLNRDELPERILSILDELAGA